MEHRFTNHLNEYYAKVISLLQDADAVLILGPGEAKGELQNASALIRRVRGSSDVETVDKMTDQQITAKVREHFRVPGGRGATQETPARVLQGRKNRTGKRGGEEHERQ